MVDNTTSEQSGNILNLTSYDGIRSISALTRFAVTEYPPFSTAAVVTVGKHPLVELPRGTHASF